MQLLSKRKVPYVEQLQQTECGLCCVAMLLRYYKSYETLQELREYLEVGRDGASLAQLSKLMKSLEFNTKIYKTEVEGLYKINTPAILFWENSHFVVLEKIDDKYAYIVDPALGRRRISIDECKNSFGLYVLTGMPNENFVQRKKSRSVWSYFYSVLLSKKIMFLKIVILSLITYLCTLLTPIIIQKLVDKIIVEPEISNIKTSFLMIFGGILVYLILSFFNGLELIKLRMHIDKEINTNVFEHLLKVPYKFFDIRAKADILFAVNSTSVIRELFAQRIIKGIIDLGAVVFILAYMLRQSILLTIVATILFLINIMSVLITRPYVLEANQYIIAEQSKLQGVQVESIYSMLGIKMSAIESNIFDSWTKRYKSYVEKYRYSEKINNLVNTLSDAVQLSSPIIILCISIYYFANGYMTIGQVLAFYSLSQTFFSLSTSIFSIWNSMLITGAYLERLKDIIVTPEEENVDDTSNMDICGDIVLKDVSFSYTKQSQCILNNINLTIKAGEKVAIVGKSGSGKSTLAKILVGLYMPTKGEICYGDINLSNINKKELRKQMGIVPQDITLFNKSIYENIAMERNDVNIDMVRNACEISQIDKEIESMPMGYNTLISEMGANLSGGQRQRIALARAILKTPKVVILDEATSSLDTINESKVSEYLKKLGCTRIVIAHRLSTIIDSDSIIVMDNGEIVEQGSHNELLNNRGKYCELYYSNNNN